MILVFYFIFLLASSGKVRRADSIVLHPERLQLLKDALGWMTFRKNAVLMEERDVESLFLDTLLQKYTTSKFYRTFVIAFHQGVLPGLVLEEGDSCDPAYTFQFKDPFNSSVTWHYQKEFTFNSYSDRMSGGGGQYCDYRQGLKCIPSTRKCGCPEGSKMQLISSMSRLQRCLLEKGEICALIDIDHGNDPSHSALASNLYHMIFNLEKPPSCKDGTQCRFKDSNRNYPLCYANNNGPWFSDKTAVSFELELGDECTIGLYASPGSCKVQTSPRDVEGYVCYNFGHPKSIRHRNPQAENRTGFCFSELGIYGVGVKDKWSLRLSVFFRPYFIAFVHPRTVPLRSRDLQHFYDRYAKNVAASFNDYNDNDAPAESNVESENKGEKCNVGKTQKMEQAWKYFSSLEAEPPSGKDYVIAATKTELFANLEIMEKEVADWDDRKRKVCKVYWSIVYGQIELPPLTCVTDSSVDADGNDGTCQLAGSGADTKELAEKIYGFQWDAHYIYLKIIIEEQSYRRDILAQNPEPECLPSLAPVPRQQGQPDNTETFELEDGYCPTGSVCYQDFSDSTGMYDNSIDCNLKQEAKAHFVCHNTTISLEPCESQHLSDKLNQVLRNLDKYEKLGNGQSCFYNLELTIRKDFNAVHYFNKYETLVWIERGICDRKLEHLECTEDGTCESMDDYSKGSEITPELPDVYERPTSSMGCVIQPCVKPVAFALINIAITSGMFTIM